VNALAPSIHSPIVSGSGVAVIHRQLQAAWPNDYQVEELSPYWGVFPPLLRTRRPGPARITHSLPELGPWSAAPGSDLVATFHNYYLDREILDQSSLAQRIYYRGILAPTIAASLRRAKWITAVSRFTAGLVRQFHPVGERLVIVRNGIDTDRFAPSERSETRPVTILFAGNPTRRKGSEHLLALARELPPGVRMQYTVGMRNSAIASIQPDPRLEPIARRDHADMPDVYAGADVLFFPTRREGFGLVVAEAMACGLPVVATNCSSIPELVVHGKGGFLFEPDDRRQMYRYLEQLSRDPGLREEMGAFNRDRILAEFPISRMIAGYAEVFAACSNAT
jgi:L-malate glycosyltransferase